MRKARTSTTIVRSANEAGPQALAAPKAVAVPALLTLAEAAEAVRLSKPTIVRAYNAGELRVFRTPGGGRVHIYADSLAAWIESNSVGGPKKRNQDQGGK